MKTGFLFWVISLFISMGIECLLQEMENIYGVGIIVSIFIIYAMYYDDKLKEQSAQKYREAQK